MKRIRIGKDISMRWEITTDGAAIPLDGRDLTVEIKSHIGIVSNIPYRVDGNSLIMTYYGAEQKRVGEYSITLWENKGKTGQNVVDVIRAFELVRTSQEENDFVGGDLQIESVDLGTENFDILTEGGYRAINIDTLQAEALEDSVNINGKTYGNESFTITLPKANLDSAGVMSSEDKQTLQEHGNRIAQIKTSCEENAADIERVSNVVDTHESRLGGIDAEISSLNTEVSTLQSKVDENTTSISQINNNIADNNKSIAQINTTLEEHNERINAKITTDRIEDGAVISEKIATSAFDDTLSVSGKIAPADVVGTKLTELEGKIAHGNKKGVPIEFVQNGYLNERGGINTSSGSKVTGFIEIDKRNKYYLYNNIVATYDNGVCYYADADETTFIGGQFNKNDAGEGNVAVYGKLNIPATANYIRIGTRSINNPNLVTFIVEEAEVSASVSSVNEIRDASYKQENILNALYPFITDVNAENIFDKNKVGDYDYGYIDSSFKIGKNVGHALSSIIVKIDDYNGVNKTYIFKYFGEKSAEDMGLQSFYLFFANEIVGGESVIVGSYSFTNMRGYAINTDKSSAYLYIQFIPSAYDYDNAMSDIRYILDNLVVIKQEGTEITYPTEYIPHTDKKIDFSIGPVPADLTADDSVSGVVSLRMVDKNGNLVGNGVTFNVGQGGGGELAADQLNVITSLTYHLQPSVLTSQSEILGTGWVGSLESGYTHTAGNTSPLELPLSGMSAKARLLITFDVQGLSETNDVYISAGDSVPIKSYNGSTEIVAGLIYDGGNLKVTPTSNFAGTITNLKCRKLDDNGSETYTTKVHNVYCQRNSLVAGYWNVFIGSKTDTASKMQDGTRNIAIGYSALDAMSVGNRNVSIGTFSMPFITAGENNVAIGSDTIYPLIEAHNCVGIGKGTLGGSTKATECVAIGAGAMGVYALQSNRAQCTVVGVKAATQVTMGNTHIGYRAGANTNGAYNTSIGYNSLGIGTRSSVDIVGTNLTCVGHDASVENNETAKAANNSTALGYGATITKSNQVVIGNNAVEEVVIGGKKIIFNEDGSVTWTTL